MLSEYEIYGEATPAYTPVADHGTSFSDTSGSMSGHINYDEPDNEIRPQKYVYKYHVNAGTARTQILITAEPCPERVGRYYSLTLSLKVGSVERTLCEPVELRLTVDPRLLEFVVFVFPPKTSLPAGCLHSLRVWVHVNGIDHQLFSEDEIWIGRDPDFNSIGDASFARLKNVSPQVQIYQGYVGRALVTFFVRWHPISRGQYNIALEYEAGGVARILFEDYRVRLDCDPQAVNFLLYTVPIPSTPHNASHRLRLWLRCLAPADSQSASHTPFSDSYIYQRIWKSDNLKLGAHLQFEALGGKMAMAMPGVANPQVLPIHPPRSSIGSRSTRQYSEKSDFSYM